MADITGRTGHTIVNPGPVGTMLDHDVITVNSSSLDHVYLIDSSSSISTSISTSWQDSFTNTGAANGAGWPQPSPTLKLNGEDADIEINGVSLSKTLQSLQDRLNILRPNAELESRWDELRQARERYQQLEQEILEKEWAWTALQQHG